MSSLRYVSTGCGPTSSAVGMFEPVTITSSVIALACPAVCGVGATSCASAGRTGEKRLAMIARHRPAEFAGDTPATTSSLDCSQLRLRVVEPTRLPVQQSSLECAQL